ncbi:MAG: hypothetical protein WBV39_15240 [Rudaea sp.]
MWRTTLLTALVAAAISAAAAPPTQGATPATASTVAARSLDPVFDCYRMNSAWGFMLAGAMIDSGGTIYRYHIQGKPWAPTPKRIDGIDWFKAADLRTKFASAKADGSVGANALKENIALIAKAATGKVQDSDTGVRDAGTSTCHAYIHDAAGQRYRDVELGSDGGVADSRTGNDAPAAQTLLGWLRSVNVAR